MTGAELQSWLDWIQDEYGEFAYRYVYAAYLAVSGGHPTVVDEISMTVDADGGYHVRAGSADGRGLYLPDDVTRENALTQLAARYCGGRYPNMAAWEAAQHAAYVEELDSWTIDQ